jgi:hypothetical protein
MNEGETKAALALNRRSEGSGWLTLLPAWSQILDTIIQWGGVWQSLQLTGFIFVDEIVYITLDFSNLQIQDLSQGNISRLLRDIFVFCYFRRQKGRGIYCTRTWSTILPRNASQCQCAVAQETTCQPTVPPPCSVKDTCGAQALNTAIDRE